MYRPHQKLPTSLPIGPSPQPRDWRVPRAVAEAAVESALHDPVSRSRELLKEAWRYFANTFELELEAFYGGGG
eukprot:1860561-Pyramimonas_sp.AAC.1